MDRPPITVRRAAYGPEDPDLLGRVFSLLGEVFPFVPAQEREARAHGLRWEEVSTPFVAEAGEPGGDVVSHVGVLEMNLVLDGEERRVGAVHGVATRPDHRGRGLFRRVMETLLPHCDARYRTLLLTTDQPALYERFGFRLVPEHRAVGRVAPVTPARPARPLDRDDAGDRARLHRLLEMREPISSRLAVRGERASFLFNEARREILLADDLDALVLAERDGDTWRLYDVVSPVLPDLDAVRARCAPDATRVELYVTADRLAPSWPAEPHVLDDDDHLLVRGPFVEAGRPIMLGRPYRC